MTSFTLGIFNIICFYTIPLPIVPARDMRKMTVLFAQNNGPLKPIV
jgi:hypothetical protein